MSELLTRDGILGADDQRIELVEVEEWGGSLYVRVMSGGERDAFEAAWSNSRQDGASGLTDIRARLCVLTACDADGKRLFTDLDIPSLTRKSSVALDRVFAVAQRLNGMTGADVDELVGNSEGGTTADSGSGLQGILA